MNRGTPPFRVYQPGNVLRVTSHRSTGKHHRFPVAEVQSTLRQVDNSLTLDANADDCKIASSLVIVFAPLLVNCTHANTLLRI
jgi:hypothetical protein